ncbi:MAG: bifunctional salicylyl-CoA 5-hydroxylase/oxidoreductase [Rhodospirillales bacterium]|nr:bifunctional salicylyl-CoA 5-hydroxylase/oxidoreductase [Rhodospirillales bacterium]
MRIACVGGGPGALYFSILMKKARPDWTVDVFERERRDVTWGFGVVFSDATMGGFADADLDSYEKISAAFRHWDNIDVFYQGEKITSKGHGFAGMSRMGLINILQDRAEELGANLNFEHPVDDASEFDDYDLVLASDGINSIVREKYKETFQPSMDWRKNKFVWLGTTHTFEDAFTFYFRENEAGLFRVHAYQFEGGKATYIVECAEETWLKAGMDKASEEETVSYLEEVFKEELEGHRLLNNKSIWRTFPTVRNARWHHGKYVLLGDSMHTAHFSIGSGTKLAMEDGIALVDALTANEGDLEAALNAYEDDWKPQVESLQRSAHTSLQWFEDVERYYGKLNPSQFAYSLLTRSLRINHENLKLRDEGFVDGVDKLYAKQASEQSGQMIPLDDNVPPPIFTPFKLREMVLQNRVVVSPMCQYSSTDGLVDDWHMVHYGSRAMGGAGLIITEMTDISQDARITEGCAGIYKEEHATAWKRIIDFVHQNSWAKVCCQLGHAGRKGSTKLLWDGIDEPLVDGNWTVIGPSPIPYTPANQVPKIMDRSDMDRVIADYVNATKLAEKAGFDMLEVHFAHGYLLSTFLSPLTNHRDDEYGGSIENRMRFPMEVFEAVRKTWATNKPISVRISATDWAEGGFTPEDALAVARALKEAGCDIIDVSAGQVVAEQEPEYGRLFQTPFSDHIRLEADIPTMTVGNIGSYGDANSILAAGRADLCAIARAHLFDPYWSRHAATEYGYDMPWPNQYSSVQGYVPRFTND